jgi:hypothetical protein
VNAEGDGHGAQRTLNSPHGRGRLALPWGAILGIILGGLVVAGLAAAVLARRRVRRAYQVRGFDSATPQQLTRAGVSPATRNAPLCSFCTTLTCCAIDRGVAAAAARRLSLSPLQQPGDGPACDAGPADWCSCACCAGGRGAAVGGAAAAVPGGRRRLAAAVGVGHGAAPGQRLLAGQRRGFGRPHHRRPRCGIQTHVCYHHYVNTGSSGSSQGSVAASDAPIIGAPGAEITQQCSYWRTSGLLAATASWKVCSSWLALGPRGIKFVPLGWDSLCQSLPPDVTRCSIK